MENDASYQWFHSDSRSPPQLQLRRQNGSSGGANHEWPKGVKIEAFAQFPHEKIAIGHSAGSPSLLRG
jgi:hypothetical protein